MSLIIRLTTRTLRRRFSDYKDLRYTCTNWTIGILLKRCVNKLLTEKPWPLIQFHLEGKVCHVESYATTMMMKAIEP